MLIPGSEERISKVAQGLRAADRPRLSRNMNGDLLLIENGKATKIVATFGSQLWHAIMDFGSEAPTPREVAKPAQPVTMLTEAELDQCWGETVAEGCINIQRAFAKKNGLTLKEQP